MANKSATVYIIDQGASMGQKRRGRDESDLEFGMRYVWDKVATAMSFNRKTEAISVVGLRTDDETDNPLSGQDGYENISVMMHLAKMEVPQLRELQDKIRPNKTENGDAISAIVVANQLICTFTRKLKYDRKIVLVTNGRGTMDDDEEQIAEVAKKLNDDGIELVVMYVSIISKYRESSDQAIAAWILTTQSSESRKKTRALLRYITHDATEKGDSNGAPGQERRHSE